MWRPEGWENPYKPVVGKVYSVGFDETPCDSYETGADALWDALWKMAKESPTGTFTIDSNVVNVYGEVVAEVS